LNTRRYNLRDDRLRAIPGTLDESFEEFPRESLELHGFWSRSPRWISAKSAPSSPTKAFRAQGDDAVPVFTTRLGLNDIIVLERPRRT
jgi:hypothetical protein